MLRRLIEWIKITWDSVKHPEGNHISRVLDFAESEIKEGRFVLVAYTKFAQVHTLNLEIQDRDIRGRMYWPYEANDAFQVMQDEVYDLVGLPSSVTAVGWRYKPKRGLTIIFMRHPTRDERLQLLNRSTNTTLYVVLP